MVKKLLYIMCALSVALSLSNCTHNSKTDTHAHSDHETEEDTHDGHNHDEHGHEGHDHFMSEGHVDESGLIIMSSDQLKILGITSSEATPGLFYSTVKVTGDIAKAPGSEGVVSARQSGIVHIAKGIREGVMVRAGQNIATVSSKAMTGGDPGESARVAYNAAKRELDRITPLHKEGIISTKDYNAVLQRVEETRAALGSTNGLNGASTSPIAGAVLTLNVVDGEYVDAGQTIATIGANNALTLRAYLPESKVSLISEIRGAKFRPTYSEDIIDLNEIGGKLISTSVSSASGGYIPVYFTIPAGTASLIGGSYCDVYLLTSPRDNVLTVTAQSISEQQGNYFVYIEAMPGHFRKQPVVLGNTDGSRREIISGIHPGDKVVEQGMTFVRLAETSGVVPEGHSHSH